MKWQPNEVRFFPKRPKALSEMVCQVKYNLISSLDKVPYAWKLVLVRKSKKITRKE